MDLTLKEQINSIKEQLNNIEEQGTYCVSGINTIKPEHIKQYK